MAEEMTGKNQAGAASGGIPEGIAAGAAETGANPPTAEQQNAFQRFLSTLFGAKEEPAAEGKSQAAAPPAMAPEAAATPPEGDFEARLQEAKKGWLAELKAEQEEEARLQKLSPEERAQAEGKKLVELEAQLLRRDLKDLALQSLQKDGYPVGLAELLSYSDKGSMEKSLAQAQAIFKQSLEAAVKERLRGKTPEGLGGAQVETLLRDQIAKNIRGGLM